MKPVFEKIKSKLIASCQAEGASPFNSPDGVAMFAKAAMQGGAAAIRSEGIEKTKKIIETVELPVIGLIKSKFEDGMVRITGCMKDVEDLINIGCAVIAVDGTFRKRESLTGPEFIQSVKSKFDCVVMADVAAIDEGIACAEAGADCVSSTLSGYTPETLHLKEAGPDFNLVKQLFGKLSVPVIAEGRINSPGMAARMIEIGAWSVVVGSAITRPALITEWFSKAVSGGVKNP